MNTLNGHDAAYYLNPANFVGYGPGVGTWLLNPTALNLYTAMLPESTGQAGLLVFNVNPTLQGFNLQANSVIKYNSQTILKVNTGTRNFFLCTLRDHNAVAAATDNVAIGKDVMPNVKDGVGNVGIGTGSLLSLTDGFRNTGIGLNALGSTTTGDSNSGIGFGALQFNTTGANNLAFGSFALWKNTIGGDNSAFGSGALSSNTTGGQNTGFGRDALSLNTTAQYNVAVGYRTFRNFNGTGDSGNSAFGALAGQACTTGTQNTIAGFQAAFNLTTGSKNTILGRNTGLGITTGSSNTIVGANVTGLSSSLASNIILADGDGNIRLQHDATGWIFGGSARFLGYTSSTAAPTTTQLPGDKDFCIHQDTALNMFYLAFNRSGTIYKAALI